MNEMPAPTVAVIVVAAGSGTRLGRAQPKAFVPVAGVPMLERALGSVFGMRQPTQVIVVAPQALLTDA
ncbi:MAG: NTP transferase domain-containing protein, partial [Leifsonia sp.]